MKKTFFVVLIIGLALFLGACNTNDGGGGGDEVEDAVWESGEPIVIDTFDGSGFVGYEILLEDYGLKPSDISNYSSVTVKATLYTDAEGTTKAKTPTGGNKNLAQFKLLKASGGWDTASNLCGTSEENVKYNMVVDGDTTWFFTSGSSGIPAKLLIQANHEDFSDGEKVQYIKVYKITFTAKTGSDPVVFDWGSVETEDFPTNTEFPGKSLPLDGAVTITGTLGDMSLYREVIVDATVYDRAGNIATASKLIDQAFFVLVTDNSNWTTYETVKQYNMAVNGITSVTPDNNKVDENKATRWKGTPTWIAFMGQYKSDKQNDEMVGKVELKSITFIPK